MPRESCRYTECELFMLPPLKHRISLRMCTFYFTFGNRNFAGRVVLYYSSCKINIVVSKQTVNCSSLLMADSSSTEVFQDGKQIVECEKDARKPIVRVY